MTAGGSIQWDNTRPVFSGLPRAGYDNDAQLSRSTGLTFDWANYDTRIREIYLQFTQHFDSGWKLKINATSWDASADYDYAFFTAAYAPMLYPYFEFTTRPNTQNQVALDTTLTGSFDVFGRRVYLVVGADLFRFRGSAAVDYPVNFSPAPINVYAFSPSAFADPRLSNQPVGEASSWDVSNQRALFGSIKVNLNDALSVIGGARINRGSGSTSNVGLGGTGSYGYETPTTATPYGGIVCNFNKTYSLYVSYADIYLSNGQVTTAAGSYLPAIQGINMELGLKGAWRNNALNATFALYDIEQKNLAIANVAADETSAGLANGCCFTTGGFVRSKGADL